MPQYLLVFVIVFFVPVLLSFSINFLFAKNYVTHHEGIVLITGASSGIGRHAAEFIARDRPGYVVLAGVRKEKDAESVRQQKIPNLRPFIIDVSSEKSIISASHEIKSIINSTGLHFIGLINNAGLGRRMPVEFHTLDDAKALFEVNFFGAVSLIQNLLPLLRESKGRIVMVSSVAGFIGNPLTGMYTATKFAIEGLSDSLRREVAPQGVSISVVQPAFVKTEIFGETPGTASHQAVSPERRGEMNRVYEYFLTDKKIAGIRTQVDRAATPLVTSEAILHALTAPQPRTRYQVARAYGMPCAALRLLALILPDRCLDAIFV